MKQRAPSAGPVPGFEESINNIPADRKKAVDDCVESATKVHKLLLTFAKSLKYNGTRVLTDFGAKEAVKNFMQENWHEK